MKKQRVANLIAITISTVIFAVLGMSLSLAANAEAQASSTIEKTEAWRSKSPELPAPRSVKLPRITSYTLANGLSVQLLPDHRVPFITVAMGIKVGSVFDPPLRSGVAGMTADMLTEGTTHRKAGKLLMRSTLLAVHYMLRRIAIIPLLAAPPFLNIHLDCLMFLLTYCFIQIFLLMNWN